MVRRVMRKPEVMAALGIGANSSFYSMVSRGVIPAGIKMNPAGRVVVWFADEIEAIQQAAVERSKTEARGQA